MHAKFMILHADNGRLANQTWTEVILPTFTFFSLELLLDTDTNGKSTSTSRLQLIGIPITFHLLTQI